MSFISVFDVIGPNMIGPSSSHTAGAAIIAGLARKMIAPPLVRVDFTLYGSFAKTYRGHGTDRALLGGVMGFATDDLRIRDSFALAERAGLAYSFSTNETEPEVHPNTVDIRMENAAGLVMTPAASSRAVSSAAVIFSVLTCTVSSAGRLSAASSGSTAPPRLSASRRVSAMGWLYCTERVSIRSAKAGTRFSGALR